MRREIFDHRCPGGLNEELKLYAVDEPGPGGANHEYAVTFHDERVGYERSPVNGRNCLISFQNGPVDEVGNNGLTIEVLLAVARDRLRGFQQGPFACPENDQAMVYLQQAMAVLHGRTLDRIQRGVEGTLRK